jgi:hypothetical protein
VKNTLLLFICSWVIVGCGRPKDAVYVKLQPTENDTLTYQYQAIQTSNMGGNKHAATIERKMGIRFNVAAQKEKNNDITFHLILKGVSMYQKMPGSGVNSFDTDYEDSIEGPSAKMLLNNFMKFKGSSSFAKYDSLGEIKSENQQLIYEKIGSSEMTDFLINHPMIFNLNDGYFWKDRIWKKEGTFKEAGINFKLKTTFKVTKIDEGYVYISSNSEASPIKEERNFELTATSKISGNYTINRKTGLIEKCEWTEAFDILAVKEGTNVPMITTRTSTLEIIPAK